MAMKWFFKVKNVSFSAVHFTAQRPQKVSGNLNHALKSLNVIALNNKRPNHVSSANK